jgi:hypothetical protein
MLHILQALDLLHIRTSISDDFLLEGTVNLVINRVKMARVNP